MSTRTTGSTARGSPRRFGPRSREPRRGHHRRRVGARIGAATARTLKADGFEVALLDRDEAGVRARAGAIGAFAQTCDVTDRAAVERAFDAVLARFGRVDVLVNNAGYSKPTRLMEIGDAEWRAMFAVHVDGTFIATQTALRAMIPARYGRIVNLSSVSALRGGGTFRRFALLRRQSGDPRLHQSDGA
nr:SDR family NAD(P)-dependent oxidoreductase [Vulcanimicrobium alpinum]